MSNFVFIVAEKIINGVIKIRDKAKRAFRAFYEKAHEYLKRVLGKYSQKDGCVLKGETHYYEKKDGRMREGSDIIHLDQELGEYYRTTVTRKVEEEEVDPRYRDIKDDEIIDNTEDINSVLSF